MKKTILLAVGLIFISTLCFAQGQTASEANPAVTIKGTIIDNMCAGSKKPEQLADFIKKHTKQCALALDCAASGYSIYADGKLTKFDKISNEMIETFLNKQNSKLDAEIVAKKTGDELSLISIKNQ